MSPVITFNTDFLAGRTTIDTNSTDYIFRPGGMDGWILNCTEKGKGQINRGDAKYTCEKGDLLLFPPSVAHDYGRASDVDVWVHLWVYFFAKPTWSSFLQWENISNGALHLRIEDSAIFTSIIRRMKELIGISKSMFHHRFDLGMNALEEILLWCSESSRQQPSGRIDKRIEIAITYIRNTYDQDITVDTIAELCSLSPSRFAHLFTNSIGVSPMRYLEQCRIRIAQGLLVGTVIPVSEVAYKSGFKDPLYFSHVFRRVTGKSPREFRSNAF